MRSVGLGVLLLCVVSLLAVPAWAIPAFPGAEGAGANSIGGRDANLTVYKVTNLNNSGTGSLRAACEASGPRVVVFTVAGYVTLTSRINITNPYIYIAGQTAPGGGICLKANGADWPGDGLLAVSHTHDVIIRYLRVRPGDTSLGEGNAGGSGIDVYDGPDGGESYNIIIDHCTVSWGNDQNGPEVWSYYNGNPPTIRDISFQRNIIAQGLLEHSCGACNGSQSGYPVGDLDYHHNLFYSNNNRNPLIGSVTASRVVSNLVYNWGRYGIGWDEGTGDTINNKLKGGSHTTCVCNGSHMDYYMWSGTGTYSMYLSGNIGYGQTSPPADQWSLTSYADQGGPAPTSYKRSPWAALSARNVAITADPADTLESLLLPEVGANWRLDARGNPMWARDTADAEFINEYVADAGHYANWSDTLPWPTLASGTAYTDSDNDGMADSWETAKFGSTSRNGKSDYDGDGYPDLEEFLNVSDPLHNDIGLSSQYVYAGSFSNTGYCGTYTGTVSNVQSSNDNYLVLHDDASTHKCGGQFTINTGLTPSGVSRMVVQAEAKTSRSDTGKFDMTVWHSDGSTYDEVRPGELFQTMDGWINWETTDISQFMTGGGVVKVDLGACPVSGNGNRYDLSVDTVRVKLFPTPTPPVANFTATPTSGLRNLAVAFTDTSTNSPTSWSWTFGDGGTSTAQNPSHTYTAFGNYTVTLTATNAGGSDSETKTNHIAVSDYYHATSWSQTPEMCGTTVSGTVTNVQSSDDSYLRLRAGSSPYRTGGRFNLDTPLTPAQVSRMTVQIESKTSRTDSTGKLALALWRAPDWTIYDDVWQAAAFGTSDAWIPDYTTTAVSTYMDSNGVIKLDFGGGCALQTQSSWDLYLDAVRVKLDP